MGRIGIMGGSGFYCLETMGAVEERTFQTPFGRPSAPFIVGNLSGKEIVFLPRHGRYRGIGPTAINYRSNLFGMKLLGVTTVVSITACGSLKENLKPLDFVIPTQFVDRTNQARKHTFFDEDVVAHVAFAHPVCEHTAKIMHEAAKACGVIVHYGGTYLNMEGPQFSTLAESNLYRSWGMDIIGMTNMVEARLAREAEMCFVSLSAVTDYDCWHPEHESVTVEVILDNLGRNVGNSRKIVSEFVQRFPEKQVCSCHEALRYAVVTPLDKIPPRAKKKLNILLAKYLP